MPYVKRREFISLLGGAAVAWPLAARAQPPDRMRRIGVLITLAADDPEAQARIGAFLQGMQESGVMDSGREGGHGNIDVNDPRQTYALQTPLTKDACREHSNSAIQANAAW